jgi:hypothetical protein
MTGRFNLGNVLELVNDAFHDGSLAQEQLIGHVHQTDFHISFEPGHQLNTPFPQWFEKSLGQIALVAEQLAKQALNQLGDRTMIIAVTSTQTARQQFSAVIGHQMQLESKEPVDRVLAALRHPSKGLVLGDTAIVTDLQWGGVDQTNPRTRPTAVVQEAHKASRTRGMGWTKRL